LTFYFVLVVNGDINNAIIELMFIFVPNIGYATVLRFAIDRMYVDAASIEKKTKEEKRKSKREIRDKKSL